MSACVCVRVCVCVCVCVFTVAQVDGAVGDARLGLKGRQQPPPQVLRADATP